jgi:hypothetical protein
MFVHAAQAEQVYWTGNDFSGHLIIQRADYNGANMEEAFRTAGGGGGMALDADAGYLFLANQSSLQPSILRTRMDGTEPTPILTEFPFIHGIGFDPIDDRLYFHDNSQKRFIALSEDGSDLQPSIVTGRSGSVESIAVDSDHRMLYWTQSGSLWRAPLDGGAVERLVSPNAALEVEVHSVALDPIARQLYWTEWHPDVFPELYGGRLRRANLDGSDAHTILHGLDPQVETEGIALARFNPSYFAIDPTAKLMFVNNEAHGAMLRANLDGAHVNYSFTNIHVGISGMATLPAVPEPSSAALALTAMTALLALRLRHRGGGARTLPTTSGRARHDQG